MADSEAGRYAGKPFLWLLERYVLSVIGELPADDAARVQQLEPKLQETFGTELSWSDIVAAQMDLNEAFRKSVSDLWRSHQEIARDANEDLDSEEWAQRFVDANLS